MQKVSIKTPSHSRRKHHKIGEFFLHGFKKVQGSFRKVRGNFKKVRVSNRKETGTVKKSGTIFQKARRVIQYFVAPIKKISHIIALVPKYIADFFGEVHHKIQRNRFLSNSYFTRIVVILFFLGINLQLLPFFLKTNRVKLPEEILNILDSAGILNKEDFTAGYIPDSLQTQQPSLDSQILLKKLNTEREIREVEPFIYSERLASVAAELLSEAEKYEFEIEDKSFTEELKKALNTSKYNYEHVSHNIVIGPLMEDAVIDAWFSNEGQVAALFEDDFKEVGFATKIIKTKYNETLGVTIQISGLEFAKKPAAAVQVSQPKQQTAPKTVFPPISNEEVVAALNSYRAVHGAQSLNINDNLCTYAEKRVGDLVAFGTLDNHDGFKNDFADPNNLPEAIRNYSGSKIAENLAFQHCKNMTTGENFIAQTGTAIIEWCFDSSTMGHKEAQQNKEFSDVCVRNAQGMFVVIFGGR